MSLPNNNINIGSPPTLWSNLKQAFDQINDNFTALDLATGGTAVDLSILNTDVSPEYPDTYTLGTITKQWKSVFTAEWDGVGPGTLNGLWAGSAQIKGIGLTIDLPAGSTVNEQLIIDPDKTFFKTINVNNDQSIEATTFGANVNFNEGLGITLTVDSAAESIGIDVNPNFNLNGSIIADDLTTVLVDRAGYLTGNVEVTPDWTITVNGFVWTFKDTGAIEFPSSASFIESGSNDELTSASANNLLLSTENDIRFITDKSASAAEWVFSNTGELTVPGPISLEFGGTPTMSLSTTGTAGRVIGETNKGFNVVLTDGSLTSDWSFNTNGKLNLSTVGIIESSNTESYINLNTSNTDIISIVTNNLNDITLITNSLGVAKQWTFSSAGTTTFPGGGSIAAGVFTGNVTGNLTGNVTGNLTGFHTGDSKGSVFGDDSSVLVDGVNGYIYGNVSATTLRTAESKISLGSGAGFINQGLSTVAIGSMAGNDTQGVASVAVGSSAGRVNQGVSAVAVGELAGLDTQGASSVAIGSMAGNDTQGSISVAIGQNAGEINQGSSSIAIGYYAGKTTQDTGAIAIGYTAAQVTQGQAGVAIGWSAGQTNQGAYAIALGYRAGFTNQNASSIVLNASGVALNSTGAGLFVNPVRPISVGKPLMYDTATSELAYSNALEFNGTTISTVDSSAVVFDGPVTFQTSVTVDGNLTVKDNLILEKRLALSEIEGSSDTLAIYSNWAPEKNTGLSIVSLTGSESITLTSDRIVAIVTDFDGGNKQWIFETDGSVTFPDNSNQTGASISIAELKVLVAAATTYADFQTAIAAL